MSEREITIKQFWKLRRIYWFIPSSLVSPVNGAKFTKKLWILCISICLHLLKGTSRRFSQHSHLRLVYFTIFFLHVIKHGLDWIGKTWTGLVKHGLIKHGVIKHGLIEHGVINWHGLIKKKYSQHKQIQDFLFCSLFRSSKLLILMNQWVNVSNIIFVLWCRSANNNVAARETKKNNNKKK